MVKSQKNKETIQRLPNFLVVGAAKAGTTSLFKYLNQHPDIYLPPLKETRFLVANKLKNVEFYNQNMIFSFDEYQDLFKVKREYKAVGEFCNSYLLFYDEAIKNIKKYLGNNTKIIIILRNPIERAFSAYQFACRNLYEHYSFKKALEKEKYRKRQLKLPPDIFWYKSYGLYYNKVKSYKKNFDHVGVWLFEDLIKDTKGILLEIFRFLDVDPNKKIKINKVYNKGGWVPAKSGVINKFFAHKRIANFFKPLLRPIPPLYKLGEKIYIFLEKLRDKLMKKKKVELPDSIKKDLTKYYKKDIYRLESLLNRDLSLWLKD